MIEGRERPLVSVIIVNWNGKHLLRECLESLREQAYPNSEVVLVDNGSTDGSLEYLKESFPWVRVLPLDRNYGFAEGNNRGIGVAEGDYVFLLNSDTVIDSLCILELVKMMEQDPLVGCCAPLICFHHNRVIVNSAGAYYDNVGFCWEHSFGKRVESIDRTIREVPVAAGCAMLIRRKVMEKTYLFDHSFFMYCEDFDFGIRLREIGYKAKLVPSAVVYHRFSASQSSQLNFQPTLFKRLYSQRNRAKILTKYYPVGILIKNLPLITLSFIYWNLFTLKRGGMIKFLRAIISQLHFAAVGFIERLNRKEKHPERWVKYMTHHSLKDLIHFARYREEVYKGKIDL
ncbi:hypothetical protein ES703_20007 [subsurface metagenome]